MFFHFEPLSIPDVIRITPARHDDEDGVILDLSLPGLESATSTFQYLQ